MASVRIREEVSLPSHRRLPFLLALVALTALLLFIPADATFLLEALFYITLAFIGLEVIRVVSGRRLHSNAKQSTQN